MAERVAVARLKEEQIEAAADLMARVFYEQIQAVSPMQFSEAQEKSYLEGYLRVIRYTIAHGEPHVASIEDKVVGLALWMAPHSLDSQEEEWVEFGIHELGAIFKDTMGHLYPLNRILEEIERTKLKQPCWYLPPRLDIDPAFTGRGVATALVRPVLLRADEGKVPCYVETIIPPMVPFFRKHGFETLVEGAEPVNGTQYWVLQREPQVPQGH